MTLFNFSHYRLPTVLNRNSSKQYIILGVRDTVENYKVPWLGLILVAGHLKWSQSSGMEISPQLETLCVAGYLLGIKG